MGRPGEARLEILELDMQLEGQEFVEGHDVGACHTVGAGGAADLVKDVSHALVLMLTLLSMVLLLSLSGFKTDCEIHCLSVDVL